VDESDEQLEPQVKRYVWNVSRIVTAVNLPNFNRHRVFRKKARLLRPIAIIWSTEKPQPTYAELIQDAISESGAAGYVFRRPRAASLSLKVSFFSRRLSLDGIYEAIKAKYRVFCETDTNWQVCLAITVQ